MNGINVSLNPFVLRRWIYGIPAPIWLKNIEMIGDVIRKNKLQPVPLESLPQIGASIAETVEKGKATAIVDRRPYPGGIRIPHLHFKSDVYLVKEEIWKDFSGRVIKDFQAKLANIKSVSFGEALELSEAVDSLG